VNRALRLGYEVAAQAARVTAVIAAQLAPQTDAKSLRALSARRGIRSRYRAWASHRARHRPLLWMHAPSVGEGLQARPVLELVRSRHPELQIAFTHFSPSAESFARGLDVDFRDYLPFDSAGDARAALDALQPTALVFSKLDVWPVLTELAHARGVRLGLVSATLAPASSRRSSLASAILRDAYAMLDAVGAVDVADAERLVSLGVRPGAIVVTGDTRYDQVWSRSARTNRAAPPLLQLHADRPTVVAGSTWPADEAVVLPAFEAVRRLPLLRDARLIIAPHEPTDEHLQPIQRWATTTGLTLARLAAADRSTDVVLVDRVGVLGDLYALAHIAFVGGGFHDAGLHSVLEPAAFGAPVLFGPRFHGSRDAVLLLDHVAARSAADVPSLADAFTAWLVDHDLRRSAGEQARELVRRGLGAAERSLGLIEGLLEV
jgi:3-deoxy-D-manno-octulosonic-acid transferase